MTEIQIADMSTRAAPNSRITKDSELFELLAVNATFDGSAAVSAFLPCVEIISSAGHTVARHVTGETVAAGGSASVTFAPFLEKKVAAPTPAGASLRWGIDQSAGDTVPSQAPGLTTKLNLDPSGLITSDVALFTVAQNAGVGPYGLVVTEVGTYICFAGIEFFYVHAYDATLLDITVSAGQGGGGFYIGQPFDGMQYVRGVKNGNQNSWHLGFAQMVIVTAAFLTQPMLWEVQQQTTHNLDVFVNVYAQKVSDDTFGL